MEELFDIEEKDFYYYIGDSFVYFFWFDFGINQIEGYRIVGF